MRLAARILMTLAVVYAVLAGGLAIAMRQPPETFGAIMAKMPPLAFLLLPFESLWMSARAGHLGVGDAAPDFTLKGVHGDGQMRLSSLRGQRPVVLVFGSYT